MLLKTFIIVVPCEWLQLFTYIISSFKSFFNLNRVSNGVKNALFSHFYSASTDNRLPPTISAGGIIKICYISSIHYAVYGMLSHPFSGLTYLPFSFTPRCRCGPVELPVLPTLPIYCPLTTFCPSLTLISLR